MTSSLFNLKVKIIPDTDIDLLEGVIILANEINNKEIIIKLNKSFIDNEIIYDYLQASPRHEGGNFQNLLIGKSVLSSLIRIPQEQIYSTNPFDVSWWRGGGAFIGDLILLH